ncbi:hypothetical protein NQZ68_035147 [Dissostichus eleginoides]|nr:hypothetical protein NQZ68_035147 [Dissostichus eleginoides]
MGVTDEAGSRHPLNFFFHGVVCESRLGGGVSPVRHTSKMVSLASWRRASQSHDRLSMLGSGAVVKSVPGSPRDLGSLFSTEFRQPP